MVIAGEAIGLMHSVDDISATLAQNEFGVVCKTHGCDTALMLCDVWAYDRALHAGTEVKTRSREAKNRSCQTCATQLQESA